MDDWGMIEAERNDFADFLEGLTPEQWDTQSLCTDWKVRHAAVHVLETARLSTGEVLVAVMKNGFNINRTLSRVAIAGGDRMSSDEVVKLLRDHAADRTKPPGVKPLNVLADAVVHHQDCRRPLGMPRPVPEDRLRASLDVTKGEGSILKAKSRIKGLQLVATDIEWSTGAGAEVRGPGEALLLAMLGRQVAMEDLEGDGVSTLRSRS